MAKFALILILVGVIITVQGDTLSIPADDYRLQYAEILSLAGDHQWHEVQKRLRELRRADDDKTASASDYSLQYTPSSTDQSADYISIGGKKVGNSNVNVGQPTNLPAIPHSFSSIPSQGAQGSHNSYKHQYSYTHSQSFVNGKPVEGGLVNNGGNFQLDTQKSIIPPILYADVRDLKPPQGGQVYGEAQFQFHTSSNVNGKVSEDQGGHKIINNNGQVQEFDFTPSVPKSPVVNYFN